MAAVSCRVVFYYEVWQLPKVPELLFIELIAVKNTGSYLVLVTYARFQNYFMDSFNFKRGVDRSVKGSKVEFFANYGNFLINFD